MSITNNIKYALPKTKEFMKFVEERSQKDDKSLVETLMSTSTTMNTYYVCFESNLTEVPHNSWWIDYGWTTHVSNMMQGFLSTRTIKPNENFVFMGNREKVPMEVVGTYHLILDTGFYLDLMNTFYVPSISRNLVSLSKLDVAGYSFKFGNGCFSLYQRTYLMMDYID